MAMNRFEHLVHTRRRVEGELSVDRIYESWVRAQSELFGDSVDITEGYRMWWSYVPHFINTPGYVYAYAYGQLLALSVYSRYLRRDLVSPRVSRAARRRRLARPRGVGRDGGYRPPDPGFWDSGLSLVEDQLARPRRSPRPGSPPIVCAHQPLGRLGSPGALEQLGELGGSDPVDAGPAPPGSRRVRDEVVSGSPCRVPRAPP